MIVESLFLKNFRNIEELEADLCPEVNIIYGKNAQGKTNIVEALWLFTGYKSFRSSRDCELIMFGKESAKIRADFKTNSRNVTCEIAISDKRKCSKNSILLQSPSALTGEYPATLFSPSHLYLIKGGPAERRRFLDIAICQLSPGYAHALKKYKMALTQRNILLKDIQYHSELYDTLEMWEAQLALFGAKIVLKRLKYVDLLKSLTQEIYDGICGGKESLSIMYLMGSLHEKSRSEQEIKEELTEKLKQTRKEDILIKNTSVGPHRDDLIVYINGKSARSYGSQGQQRSAALALKLGETQVIREIIGENPIVLLDDVMSELDYKRQDYVLNKIKGYQVVITSCEPPQSKRLTCAKMFQISDGRVVS